MNYPKSINKVYKKTINYANRGMDLESLINQINDYYIDNDIAIIYKKPTPIQVVRYDYNTKRITDAFYKTESTLDYNGLYKGYYIEFDAKNTNKNYLPLSNIAVHQIKHMKNILNHKGICFLLIGINNEFFALPGAKIIEFINNAERKSIPYDYINENGYKLNYNYLKGIDYIKAVDCMIKENIWRN